MTNIRWPYRWSYVFLSRANVVVICICPTQNTNVPTHMTKIGNMPKYVPSVFACMCPIICPQLTLPNHMSTTVIHMPNYMPNNSANEPPSLYAQQYTQYPVYIIIMHC